ncbi:MAG: peptide methionine sulfoxide reductase msrA/msrB [Verrucomicrobiales bacterium]|jgi:peptide methionine sulfoxide reductase msrA/msrB
MKLSRRPFLLIGLTAVIGISTGSCREEEPKKKPTTQRMDSATPLKIKQKDRGYKPWSDEELKKKLNPIQYKVTQKEGTERSGTYPKHNSKDPGIYVDIISGEPLFSSTEKFDSGTGWPSFWAPIHKEEVIEKEDRSLFSVRTEVRSKTADSHLGHVFPDGPKPTGLRYCINGASLRFVPKAELSREGYEDYLKLFNETSKEE